MTSSGTDSPPSVASRPAAAAPGAPELLIDGTVARRIIGEFIGAQLRQAGFERALVGLSGGIDSALVAYLVSEAIGADRLLAVLMPYRTSDPASRSDAQDVARRIGCAILEVDITPMVDAYFADASRADASPVRRGNYMARTRMAVLYDQSVPWGGLVVGTGNKTETLIGYTTIYGDNASAFNPIGDLYKTQVRQLAAEIGVPERIIAKAPSADLWPGQTDEGEGGFDYAEIDRLLLWMVDKRRDDDDLVAMGFDGALVERVGRMVARSEYKRQTPPIAKIGPRTPGVDYLYPRRRPGSARRQGG
jgi:NAD+ synthase